jgi:hypothetical protein
MNYSIKALACILNILNILFISVLTADIFIEKLSACYATILLALGQLQNQQQYQLSLVVGGVVVLIALFVWNYYILSIVMTVYWMVIALLLWPQLHRYHSLRTLKSIMQFYREQLELSFLSRQKTQDFSDPKADDDDDFMYPISDELTGVAFERALGEELGYETHETQDTDKSLPETRVEDEPRIAQRHDSIFGLEVDEMPSIAVGEDANSDDEWAFDAETASLAEEMHFTADLEFPSLSQDSIDYHQAVQRRNDRRRTHERSRLADLPEVPSPVASWSAMLDDEVVVNKATSTPVMSTSEIVSRSSVHDKVQPAERPHVETGHSSGDPIRRRKLPQIPQSSETTRVHDKVQPAERPHVETGHSSGDPIRRRKLPQIPQSSETTRPRSLDTVEVNSIYLQKGLRPQSSLTTPMSTSLQSEMSDRLRSVATAPAAVLTSESVNDWNFQGSIMAVGKSLNEKEKLDLSDFDIPDQSEIESARRSAEMYDQPSSWLFG